jgi:hypothetical protein
MMLTLTICPLYMTADRLEVRASLTKWTRINVPCPRRRSIVADGSRFRKGWGISITRVLTGGPFICVILTMIGCIGTDLVFGDKSKVRSS